MICKSCGSEVSPYITECPYCGNRLRKRAPKIDREGRVAERRRRRPNAPSLPRLRRNEIPGIRPDARHYAMIALVLVGFVGCLLWRTGAVNLTQVAIDGVKPGTHWWRLLTASFTYVNTGYAIVTIGAIALFGWLLERRHGPAVVLALYLIGGVGGIAATAALYPAPVAAGADGAAIAMIIVWVIPDLLALRDEEDIEGDLLGAVAIAAVVALMPVAAQEASWAAVAVGALAGLIVGLPLARLGTR